jgi:hypothetical protein
MNDQEQTDTDWQELRKLTPGERLALRMAVKADAKTSKRLALRMAAKGEARKARRTRNSQAAAPEAQAAE